LNKREGQRGASGGGITEDLASEATKGNLTLNERGRATASRRLLLDIIVSKSIGDHDEHTQDDKKPHGNSF